MERNDKFNDKTYNRAFEYINMFAWGYFNKLSKIVKEP